MTKLEELFGLDQLPPKADRSQVTLTDGSAVTADYSNLEVNGQQKAYVVLSAEERAKGFVRPLRHSYVHIGPPPPRFALRALTEAERLRYPQYAAYEAYPKGNATVGRFWTRDTLRRLENPCKGVTTMQDAIAATYARDPGFYGATFCATCRQHFPVGERGEFVWVDAPDERVGT